MLLVAVFFVFAVYCIFAQIYLRLHDEGGVLTKTLYTLVFPVQAIIFLWASSPGENQKYDYKDAWQATALLSCIVLGFVALMTTGAAADLFDIRNKEQAFDGFGIACAVSWPFLIAAFAAAYFSRFFIQKMQQPAKSKPEPELEELVKVEVVPTPPPLSAADQDNLAAQRRSQLINEFNNSCERIEQNFQQNLDHECYDIHLAQFENQSVVLQQIGLLVRTSIKQQVKAQLEQLKNMLTDPVMSEENYDKWATNIEKALDLSLVQAEMQRQMEARDEHADD